MKRKFAALYAVLAAVMLMQSVTFADVQQNDAAVVSAYENAVSSGQILDGPRMSAVSIEDDAEDTEVEAYAAEEEAEDLDREIGVGLYDTSSDNFINIELVSNGKKYTLVANKAYKYVSAKDDTKVYVEKGAIITNIAADSKKELLDSIDIPAEVADSTGSYPVIAIGEAAFDNCFAKSITVPSSVLSIGDRAFTNCPNLTSIYVNGSSTTPVYSYEMVSGSKKVTKYEAIPTVIGNSFASNCPKLATVKVAGFSEMGSNSFENDTALTNVDISVEGYTVASSTGAYNEKSPRTMTIGDSTFLNCSSLTDFTVGKGVKTMGKTTFHGCKKLKNINIMDEFTGGFTYEDFILANPTALKDVVSALSGDYANKNNDLYNALLSKETAAFDAVSCSELANFTVSADNKNFSAADGILFDKKATKIFYIPMNSPLTDYTVPDTVKTIDSYAAYRNRNLANLTSNIVDEKTGLAIGNFAFSKSNIKTVSLSRISDITLGEGALRECRNLTKFETPYNHGGSVGAGCLLNCDKLDNLVLGGEAEGIGKYAFAYCDGLTSVNADYGVGTINERAFECCQNLEDVDIHLVGKGLVKDVDIKFGIYIFGDCTKLKKCILPDTLLGISSGTFHNCISLTDVECPDDTARICSLAFDNCPKLVNIPQIRFLVKLDKAAFVNCTSLKRLDLTRSVMFIDDEAFENTPNVTIYSPKDYVGESYAYRHSMPWKEIADDIEDWEFLIYSPVDPDAIKEGDMSANRKMDLDTVGKATTLHNAGYPFSNEILSISGYRGGFTKLKIPNDHSLVFSDYMSTNWISRPLGDNTCSMQKIVESLDLEGVHFMADNACANMPELVELKLSPEADQIANKVFYKCAKLAGDPETNTLTLPLSLSLLGDSAFEGCTTLEKVDTDITSEHVNSDLVSDDFKIGSKTFAGCTALKEFNSCFVDYAVTNDQTGQVQVLKYYLKEMGEESFKGCTALERVYFNGNLEKIGPHAFENCTSLTAVTLDNSVLVQSEAFKGCTNITGAIIVGEANVAVSNDPFCTTTKLNIATTDASKAQTYVDYKNGQSSDNSYSIEIRNFKTINGKNYMMSTLQVPNDVIVYKNGKQMDTSKEYVLYTNDLEFVYTKANPDKSYIFSINDVPVGTKYTVKEFEPEVLVVTFKEVDSLQLGDVNGDGEITSVDSAITLQHVLNPAIVGLDEAAIERADVNGGGVSASDAAAILQKVLLSTFEFTKQ